MSRAARGMTLAEALIGLGLLGLLLSVLVGLLIPSVRLSVRTQTRLDLTRGAAEVAGQLQRDLETSAAQALYLEPSIAAMQPLAGLNGDGVRLWSPRWVIFQLDGSQRVNRQIYAIGPADPSLMRAPQAAPLMSWLSTPGSAAERRVLAWGVKSFAVTARSEGAGTAVSLRLLLEVPLGDRPEPERVVWDQTMRLVEAAP